MSVVMTWNIRYFGHGTGGLRASDAWIHAIAEAIAAAEPLPDVIALQEVEAGSLRGGSGPQLGRFVDALERSLAGRGRPRRYAGTYFPAHRYGTSRRALMTTGLAVLVADDHVVEAADTAEITHVRLEAFARLKQRRIAAKVRVRAPDGFVFELVNTHLSLPAFFEVGPHRVPHRMGFGSNQLAEVDQLLAFVAPSPDRPVVVAGDFNSRPGSPVYDRIVARGLADARAASGAPETATAAFLHLRMHIDHLFATPALRWSWVRAHSVDDGPYRGLSDHAPTIGQVAARSAG